MNTDEMRIVEAAASTPAAKHRARTLGVMHLRWGVGTGICGECPHFFALRVGAAGHAFKCRQFKVSSSAASDWRKGWPACGLKEARR